MFVRIHRFAYGFQYQTLHPHQNNGNSSKRQETLFFENMAECKS